MFGGLKRVVFQVSNIQQAKDWYGKVFEVAPLMEAPFAVVFKIEDSELILMPNPANNTQSNDNAVAFWRVDDVDYEYTRLLKIGATSHGEIKTVFGTKRASLVDPFGNILGIMSSIKDDSNKTVEETPSKTALGVTLLRALATTDPREEVRGADYIAEIFLPEDGRKLLQDHALRELALKKMPGMYEYLIARTAYFDYVVKEALQKNIPQIVFLGAGYDSRAYRFKDYLKDTQIFELDIHTTQQRKKDLLAKAKIPIPQQLQFVPINFNTENLQEVLCKGGFDLTQKSLFIWEGVTYYLPPKAIDDTLSSIQSNMPAGTQVSFDYIVQSPEILEDSGIQATIELMKSKHGGEPVQFAIKNGELEAFLAARGYKLIHSLSANEMEQKYLILRDGSLGGKVLPSFCIASVLVGDK